MPWYVCFCPYCDWRLDEDDYVIGVDEQTIECPGCGEEIEIVRTVKYTAIEPLGE